MVSRIFGFSLVLCGLICFGRTSHAQSVPMPTNSGTDFLLCFEQNDAPEHHVFDSAMCFVYVANSSATDTAVVTITSKHFPKLNKQFILAPQGSQSYRITDDCPDIWITSQDGTTNDRAVHVVSTSPIVCYGMNYVLNTCDAFMAIPKDASGSDYRIMSYANSAYMASPMPSQFAVAAFSDNTHVTIIPSSNTLSSTTSIPKTGHNAGIPFTVTLMAGECIQVQTDATILNGADPNASDLTGSTVFADSVVAVYAGHARTEIPFNYTRQQDIGTSRDILI